tara:strand:+ start:249 stop:491 length:243 start_codon:yes stop_codon:yes gene_type:complete
MKQINKLSKSDSYIQNLDMDKLIKSVKTSLKCTPKLAEAVAKLISAKIFLEIVCEEEENQAFLDELDSNLNIYHVEETLH